MANPKEHIGITDSLDPGFLSILSSAGIFDSAHRIGLDVDKYLLPLARYVNHSYRRYRWSLGYHESGGEMISALPPEEETGWTPWERWYKDAQGLTRKESWVMYPLRDPDHLGIARWYKLDEKDLMPWYLRKSSTLEDKLRQA